MVGLSENLSPQYLMVWEHLSMQFCWGSLCEYSVWPVNISANLRFSGLWLLSVCIWSDVELEEVPAYVDTPLTGCAMKSDTHSI